MIDRHIARAEESILATLRLDDADAIDDVQLAELRAALTTLVGAVCAEGVQKLPAPAAQCGGVAKCVPRSGK